MIFCFQKLILCQRRYGDAEKWALKSNAKLNGIETPNKRAAHDPTTLGEHIDRHIDDMKEVQQAPRRSKPFTLGALKDKVGKAKLKHLTAERVTRSPA